MTGPFDDGRRLPAPRLCGNRWQAGSLFRCRCYRAAGHPGMCECVCGEQRTQNGPDAPATPDPSAARQDPDLPGDVPPDS